MAGSVFLLRLPRACPLQYLSVHDVFTDKSMVLPPFRGIILHREDTWQHPQRCILMSGKKCAAISNVLFVLWLGLMTLICAVTLSPICCFFALMDDTPRPTGEISEKSDGFLQRGIPATAMFLGSCDVPLWEGLRCCAMWDWDVVFV